MTATIHSFPNPGAGAARLSARRGAAPAPAPRVRPLRECLCGCGRLTTGHWASDRCWRAEDGGEGWDDGGDAA